MNENVKMLGVGVILVLLFFGICFNFLTQNLEIESQDNYDYSQDMCVYEEYDYSQDMCPIDNNLYCPYYVFEGGF